MIPGETQIRGETGAAVSSADGVPLARLFSAAFTALIDGLHEQLTVRGWPDVRPGYGYVLLAARGHASSITTISQALGVTKQAASQVVDAMVGSGYLSREPDPTDARTKVVLLTERGHQLLAVVEEIYAELEAGWAEVIGARSVARIRADLTRVLLAQHGGVLPELRAFPAGGSARPS